MDMVNVFLSIENIITGGIFCCISRISSEYRKRQRILGRSDLETLMRRDAHFHEPK